MSVLNESGVGLELIQLETTKILFENLNKELSVQESKWESRDKEWNRLTGQLPIKTELEHIQPENFHSGHRPSLIETSPERYPNVSVMAYRANPIDGVFDQLSNFNVIIDIETMVKGQSEIEVDRRNHRTVEAVHQVLTRNESLNGTSKGFDNDPLVQLSDIFIRDSQTSHGEKLFWAGARVRYNITRNNTLPSIEL